MTPYTNADFLQDSSGDASAEQGTEERGHIYLLVVYVRTSGVCLHRNSQIHQHRPHLPDAQLPERGDFKTDLRLGLRGTDQS